MVRGRSLGFSRDGSYAVVSSGTDVHFVAINQQVPASTVTLGPLHDLAAVGNQIWIAAGNPARLRRD